MSGINLRLEPEIPPEARSRNSPSYRITAWSSTGRRPPASSSRCCTSPRPRPTPSGCWSSRPSSPTSWPRSSTASAATAAPSRSSAPTTSTSASHPPMPLLFQHRCGAEAGPSAPHHPPLDPRGHRTTGLTDPGQPLRFTPHDFRRILATDAIMHGMPPHIAQLLLGHRDINTTMGYKAVYPEEAITGHRAFIARRRGTAPQRGVPHPDRRGMGGVPRPLRAPQARPRRLRPGLRNQLHPRAQLHPLPAPARRPRPAARLEEIRASLIARIAEAEREGWTGEAEGLKVSLTAADAKLAETGTPPPAAPRGRPRHARLPRRGSLPHHHRPQSRCQRKNPMTPTSLAHARSACASDNSRQPHNQDEVQRMLRERFRTP